MWHYVKTEPNLWTVGFGEGKNWTTDSDHESAANRVAFLNGEKKEEFVYSPYSNDVSSKILAKMTGVESFELTSFLQNNTYLKSNVPSKEKLYIIAFGRKQNSSDWGCVLGDVNFIPNERFYTIILVKNGKYDVYREINRDSAVIMLYRSGFSVLENNNV